MTEPEFKLSSLFNTPAKRMSAAIDFCGGLLASLVLGAAAWVMG